MQDRDPWDPEVRIPDTGGDIFILERLDRIFINLFILKPELSSEVVVNLELTKWME